nr:TMEM175 family protein [Rathayibacter iranicus]
MVNLTDATVAIAITFLVLPLVDIVQEGRSPDLGTLLAGNYGTLSAFFITFAVIGRLWMVHHSVFEGIGSHSPALVVANFVWLAAVVLLPFTANLMSNVLDTDASVIALYVGTMIVASSATLAMQLIVRRDRDLLVDRAEPPRPLSRSLIAIGILVVALVLAVSIPAVNMFALLLLLLSGPIERLLHRRQTVSRTVRTRTAHGLDRLVNFSDATVAIALTVLVLPLVEIAPEIGREGGGVGTLLADHLDQVLAFALSFTLTAVFWIPHHRVFDIAGDYDGGLIWLDLLWLVALAFFPFSTSALAVFSDSPATIGLYIGTMAAMSGALVLIEARFLRHPELRREDVAPPLLARALAPFYLLLLALALALLAPAIGLWWLLLLVVQRPVAALLARASRRRSGEMR